MVLAELMHNNKSLEVVDVRNCHIGSKGACHLAKTLCENTTVWTLDLSYNPIRTEAAMALESEYLHYTKGHCFTSVWVLNAHHHACHR